MLAVIEVPGIGQAIAGLDWLTPQGLDSRRTEIVQFGRGVQADWEYVWTEKDDHDREEQVRVAMLSRRDSRRKPVAAAALVNSAIADDTYVILIGLADDQDEQRYWLLAVERNLPVTRMDLVGSASEVTNALKDYLNRQEALDDLPLYSDQVELVAQVEIRQLSIRQFSLGILAHSVKKRDLAKARFNRHTSLPVIPIVACAALIFGVGAYWLIQVQAEDAARRDAAIQRAKAIELRKQELAIAVSTALNSALPAPIAVSAFLNTVSDLKRLMDGWQLREVECALDTCTLVWRAQAFATWDGYLKAKPVEWPAPVFDNDIEKVTQPLPVQLAAYKERTVDDLPGRDEVRQGLGNLAQRSKNLGLALSVPASWQRVAGNPALNSPDERWVPVAGDFTASGTTALLEGLASRLPSTADVVSVTFKLEPTLMFELKGKAYANP